MLNNTGKCPTCGMVKKRSKESNRLYWRILHLVCDTLKVKGKGYTAETWSEYFKQRFLGAEEVDLPNGKTIVKTVSSASLSQDEFSEYIEQVLAWCAEHNIYLPDEEGSI